jgi:hypothetical protein
LNPFACPCANDLKGLVTFYPRVDVSRLTGAGARACNIGKLPMWIALCYVKPYIGAAAAVKATPLDYDITAMR